MSESIPFKQWRVEEAQKEGITAQGVYMRVQRGKYPSLKLRRENARVVYVESAMTTKKLEQVLCASLMDEPTAKISPAIATAIAFAPDYWESVEARIVAVGIKEAMNKGRPTHREVVRRYLPLDYQDWIDHPTFKDGLPLSCIDHQVKDLLTVYETKRIARMIEKAHGDILWGVDAREVAEKLRSELEGVL